MNLNAQIIAAISISWLKTYKGPKYERSKVGFSKVVHSEHYACMCICRGRAVIGDAVYIKDTIISDMGTIWDNGGCRPHLRL